VKEETMRRPLFLLYQKGKAHFINTIRDQVIGVEEHDFGVWRGGKSARGAHRNSKAKSAFFDGGTQKA
jgi:hypothetical protein